MSDQNENAIAAVKGTATNRGAARKTKSASRKDAAELARNAIVKMLNATSSPTPESGGRERLYLQTVAALLQLVAQACSERKASGAKRVEFDWENDIEQIADCLERDDIVALGAVYEHLLEYKAKFDDASSTWSLTELKRGKKREGKFYTPQSLVDAAVREALSVIVSDLSAPEILQLKIVDPAMGCGYFLVSALNYLAAQYAKKAPTSNVLAIRRLIAKNCLFGVDLDPLSVYTCRLIFALALKLNVFDEQALSRELPSLKCGNALVGAVSSPLVDTKYGAGKPLGQFNWSSEFELVFARENPGFDAVIGNPPWEIEKANSREFFSQFDQSYYSYGKQKALERQVEIARHDSEILLAWQRAQSEIEDVKEYLKANYKLQGGADINAYKLFIERAFHLCRQDGVFSLIVPSGLYSDKGTTPLRNTLLEKCRWHLLSSFINSDSLFEIHRSFKFCLFVAQKGGQTDSIACQFWLRNPEQITSLPKIAYTRQLLSSFSPSTQAVFEFRRQWDIEFAQKVYEHSTPLSQRSEWRLNFKREFDMTNDSALFIQRDEAERNGFVQDIYGHWLKGSWCALFAHQVGAQVNALTPTIRSAAGDAFIAIDKITDVCLPLYEGRMVGQFNANDKHWLEGKGRSAEWRMNPDTSALGPQYLIDKSNRRRSTACPADSILKIGFLNTGAATNSRTMVASCLADFPCGNSVPVMRVTNDSLTLYLLALLNSFVFDYILRLRMSGNNLNYFLIEECPVPRFECDSRESALLFTLICSVSASLNLNHFMFASQIHSLIEKGRISFRSFDSNAERRVWRGVLDAMIGHLYGLSVADMRNLFEADEEPECATERNPIGFWRVDNKSALGSRLTDYALSSFVELTERGFSEYVSVKLSEWDRLPALETDWQYHAKMIDAVRQISSLEACNPR